MKKEEGKMDLVSLEGFSEETLNEMTMEAVEGGGIVDNVYCPNKGNCVAGCSCSGGEY